MNPSSPSRDGDPDRPESTARPGRAAPGIRLALSLGLSLAALIYVGLKIDFARLWELLWGMNPLYILGVWAFLGLSYLMRAARWQRLLRPVAPARLGTLFSAVLIGFMANNLLPARLGELVRAYAARRLVGVPVSAVLGSLVVERLLDALTFLLLIFVTLLFVDPAASAGGFSTAYLRGAALGLLALYAAVVAVLLALRRRPERVIAFLARLAGRISSPLEERTAAALTAFNQGLGMLGRGRGLPGLLAMSLLVTLPHLVSYTVFLPAMGLPLDVLWGAMALVGAAMAASIPAGPGHIGTFQLGVMWALMLAGAPAQPAAAFGLLYWAICFVGVGLAGLVTMWRAGLKGLFGAAGGGLGRD